MRILHTADLHLGRQLHNFSLTDDHQVVLDQVIAALEQYQPDLFIIAGDVFDRPAPPASAQRQFNAFLARARSVCDAAFVMIAGNHDSPDRIEAMAVMANPDRDLIRGVLRNDEPVLMLDDVDGPVAVSALPFGYENAARECFMDADIATPQDVMRAQVAAARAQVPDGARWIIVAHAFVAGGESSDSEKALTRVGGIEYVSSQIFDGADYVALGHLHRPQKAGRDAIRYSGAPLGLGFDEGGAPKSMVLIEMDATGQTDITLLPFTPLRGLRTLRGKLDDLLSGTPLTDYVKVILTDDTPQIDPMKRLRDLYPLTCQISYARDESSKDTAHNQSDQMALLDDPVSLIAAFLTQTRNAPTRTDETPLIADALTHITRNEDET